MPSIDAPPREQEVAGLGRPYIFTTQLDRAQRDIPINSAVHARVWRRERIATGCNFRMRPAMRANRKSSDKAAPYIYCTQLGRAKRDNPINSTVHAHVRRRERIATGCNFRMRPAMRANRKSPDKARPSSSSPSNFRGPYFLLDALGSSGHVRRRERIATGCNFPVLPAMAESGGAKFGHGSVGIVRPRAA